MARRRYNPAGSNGSGGMDNEALAFIGGGNMACALIGGLLEHGWAADAIRVADPIAAARDSLRSRYPGIGIFAGNLEAATGASTWVLAVKPQQMREVSIELAPLAQASRPLVISIAAGIRRSDLVRWLGPGVAVVRGMPNRPALLGCGISALCAGGDVEAAGRLRAATILGAVGERVWVEDESLMDAVTAVSGSGPAYVFLLVEMLESAALAEGFDAGTARRLAIETVYGAARMAREGPEEPAVLREQVTSKGGTTAAALAVLEEAGIRAAFARAIRAGTERSRQLAEESGG
jgi:pyrroline-5-carboxylate reductase